MERSVEATSARAKGKKVVTSKKEKGVLLKKPVSKDTGKRKKSERNIGKGPGPSAKSAKTLGYPGIYGMGTGSSKKAIISSRKKKGLSREVRLDILKTQEVLREKVFDPVVTKLAGMGELVDKVKFQNWEHLFEMFVP